MNHLTRVALLFCAPLFALCFGGCSQPDEIKKIDGPGNGVTFVVETTYGSGAATSDYIKVFASPQGNKNGKRALVLSGENLDLRKIAWTDAGNADICLVGGITDRYANQVMVGEAGSAMKVKIHLIETC